MNWGKWLAGLMLIAVSFSITFINNFPAASAWQAIRNTQARPPLELTNIQGSLWRASATMRGTQWPANIPALDVRWQLEPLALLGLRVAGEVQIEADDDLVLGHIDYASNGELKIRELRASLAMQRWLNGLTGIPIQTGGQLSLQISELRLNANGYQSAIGHGHIDQAIAPWPGGDERVDLSIEIGTEDQRLTLFAQSHDTPTRLEALLSLSHTGSYNTDVHITPGRDTAEPTRRFIAANIPRESDGRYKLSVNGQL